MLRIVQRSSDEKYRIAKGVFDVEYYDEYFANGTWWSRDYIHNATVYKDFDSALQAYNKLKYPEKVKPITYRTVYPDWMVRLIFWK